MKLKLQNTPIGQRIALALALPILGLLFFALWVLSGYQQMASSTRSLREMAELAPAINTLVHELQLERGTSAGFIGSGGRSFADALPLRQTATDQKLQDLTRSLAPFQRSLSEERLGLQIQEAQKTIKMLPLLRRAVGDRVIAVDELTARYSQTIGELIAIIKEMLLVSTSAELSRAISAYVHLMEAKELLGMERAVGVTYFSGGRMESSVRNEHIRLIERQKLSLEQFRFLVSPEQNRLLEDMLSGVESAELERLRHIVLRDPRVGAVERVEATHWFDTMTKRINRLKLVEDVQAGDLIAQAQTIEEEAQNSARWVSAITLLALALTVAIAAALARGIIFPIRRITGAMTKLAAQDEAVEIEDHQRGDEIGDMARATLVFRDNLLRIGQAEERLKNEAIMQLHHKALSSISQGVLITDAQRRITFVNAAFLKITGYDEAEMLGRSPHFLYGPQTDPEALNRLRDTLVSDRPEAHAVLGYRKSGTPFWCEVSVTPVLNSQGQRTHVVSVMRDITESRQLDQEMRIAAIAFESLHGMMVTDDKGAILRVNQAFTEMTGYRAEEVLGQSPAILKSGRHESAFYTNMWQQLQATGQWYGEVWDRRKNGEIFPKWQTISAVSGADAKVTHYVAAFSDISERKEAEEKIRSLAFYDALTGLPNRRLLLDRLQQALLTSERSGRQGALLFIDLDHFKTINDTLGHHVGDSLLVEVAHRLQTCLRACDTAARLGGDEFVVMLEDLSEVYLESLTQVETVSEKILSALNQRYQLVEGEHRSTPSIGITLFNGQHTSMDDLLKQADLAMYQAKAAGRNTLRFFDPKMQAVVTHRAALESDLRDSLEKKEFLLFYQAQVDTQGYLTGAEALVRWQHPRRGLVSPMEFIPLAEETGLILPLGLWVLETACTQLTAWAGQPATAHLTMAVNVSARQFRQTDFVEQVLGALERTGANPLRLKLELTESLLLDDIEVTINKMTRLKAVGVGFSLDDFGTGYSSLSYLKRLPLDQLKIDRSFITDVLTDTNDAVIARTIVGLANSMGLSVIAEGVEIEAQRSFLEDNGCHAYQGYLFGQPGAVELLRGSKPGLPGT
jgi:diguanylate cyclase (GGDEF)-like protein/PAS domain S-box-containing protein